MDINNLPQGYHKAATECDFYFWDGFGANKPNEVKGRLLLIGVYDMYKEPKFGCVRLACTESLDLTFSDASNCSSKNQGALSVDGISDLQINDRILLAGQTNAEENGIYLVMNPGSEAEAFELKRSSDANAINALAPGKFVGIREGNSLAGHIFQLMPYNTKDALGVAKFNFIDLTKEGFYANQINGFRLVHSIACTQIDANKNIFTFACPDFLNIDTPRLLKVLVSWDVKVEDIMKNLLTKEFDFSDSLYAPNCCTRYL